MCKVSIIIPTYNNAHLLRETLESVINQDYQDFELIVVDDGSTDNTRELVISYGNKITYIYQENSGGCSKPRNVGIQCASGEYIAMFDSDDIMKPDKIGLQADFLDLHPDVNFVFTDFCDFNSKEIFQSHTSGCTLFNHLTKNKVGSKEYIVNNTDSYQTLLFENFIGGSSMMFRKSLVEKVGFYDESFDVCEDIDLTLRISKIYNLGYIDKVCHLRRLHDGNITSINEKIIVNRIRVLLRHLPICRLQEFNRDLKKQIANLYWSLGYYYRENKRYRDSLQCHINSIKTLPMPNRSYFAFTKTVFKIILRPL